MFYIRTTTDGKWKCVCYESGTDWPLTSSPYELYWPTPEECPADTYKDTVSAVDCTPCPNSTTNGYIGAYTIGICQPRAGYEWVGSEILLCARTHYKATDGRMACQECTGGAVGSDDRRECVCEPGSLMTDGSCVPCAEGTYSYNGACEPCTLYYSTMGQGSSSLEDCLPERGYRLPNNTLLQNWPDLEQCPTDTYKDTVSN